MIVISVVTLTVIACMISGGIGAIAGAWCMYRYLRDDCAQQRSGDGS